MRNKYTSSSADSNNPFIQATRKYLKDFADEGHTILPGNLLVTEYGFSKSFVSRLERVFEDDNITSKGRPVRSMKGVGCVDLLYAIADELGIDRRQLDAAAGVVGCSPYPMGRGTEARLYTAAIRTALGTMEALR
jgi:hypothetical protein